MWQRLLLVFMLFQPMITSSFAMEPGTNAPRSNFPGTYQNLADHPRVFRTQAELTAHAARIGVSGSYSQQIFQQLAGRIAHDQA